MAGYGIGISDKPISMDLSREIRSLAITYDYIYVSHNITFCSPTPTDSLNCGVLPGGYDCGNYTKDLKNFPPHDLPSGGSCPMRISPSEVGMVIVDLYSITGAVECRFRWYNKDSGKLLYDITIPYTCAGTCDVWMYSIIGHFWWEIDSPGNYQCQIDTTYGSALVDFVVVDTRQNATVEAIVYEGSGSIDVYKNGRKIGSTSTSSIFNFKMNDYFDFSAYPSNGYYFSKFCDGTGCAGSYPSPYTGRILDTASALYAFFVASIGLVNGTFDTDLFGWTLYNNEPYAEVSWDNGRARLRGSSWWTCEMTQKFKCNGDKLYFEYETFFDGTYHPDAHFEFYAGAVYVYDNLTFNEVGDKRYVGSKTFDISGAVGENGTIWFSLWLPSYEPNNTYVWIDNIKIISTIINPQIFNVCWGEGQGSPCSVPPNQPSVIPSRTINIVTDIANNGYPTTIRAVTIVDGVTISDRNKFMDTYPTEGLWSISAPYTVPNKNVICEVYSYGWDGIEWKLTDSIAIEIPVDATTALYYNGDYHNLKTGVTIATIDPVQSTFDYGIYPMGNPLDPSYCATQPNKSLDQSKSTFVAVLMNLFNVYISGRVTFNWYRTRDNKLLRTNIVDIPNPVDWGYSKFDWYSVWSWICKIPGGIEEPGAYHVEILAEPYEFSNSIPFTVTCGNPVANFKASDPATLNIISIIPTSADLAQTAKQQFTASCKDTDGMIVVCPTLSWNSSNTAVGTVDSNGLFTAIALGTTNVTASASGKTSNAAIVNVIQKLGTISITPSSVNLERAKTQQFTASCKDTIGNTMTCPSLSWNSSNTAVGTVDSNGLFTAIALGTTNVTASASGKTSNAAIVNVEAINIAIGKTPTKFGVWTYSPGGLQYITDGNRSTKSGMAGSNITSDDTTYIQIDLGNVYKLFNEYIKFEISATYSGINCYLNLKVSEDGFLWRTIYNYIFNTGLSTIVEAPLNDIGNVRYIRSSIFVETNVYPQIVYVNWYEIETYI